MKLSVLLMVLQLWGNVEVSLSQNDLLSCKVAVMHSHLYVAGLPPAYERMKIGHKLRFQCSDEYALNGSEEVECLQTGQWNTLFPTCVADITCKVGVMHSHLYVAGLPPANETMKTGHELQFRCSDEYALNGSEEVKCLQTGQWNTSFPTCVADKCKVTGVPNTVRIYAPNNLLGTGEHLRFACRQAGHILRGNTVIECLAGGQWNHPFPTCGEPLGCGRPPFLEDGDIKGHVQTNYSHNEKVEYVCQNYYTIEGGPQTCFDGKWIGQMKCLKPCTVDVQESQNNVVFRYTDKKKLYVHHKDQIEFTCIRGKQHDSVLSLRQTCVDGVVDLPTCL
ncbi:complement factor H-like [Dicentrarchus labrax]|uniref:complement factor H-like n=1 Tax=Dicentrarchus labrax TaxID=13489 RepID=UPI0021F56BCF|nr:complement factor H-like [Dicentrarchus labrax]